MVEDNSWMVILGAGSLVLVGLLFLLDRANLLDNIKLGLRNVPKEEQKLEETPNNRIGPNRKRNRILYIPSKSIEKLVPEMKENMDGTYYFWDGEGNHVGNFHAAQLRPRYLTDSLAVGIIEYWEVFDSTLEYELRKTIDLQKDMLAQKDGVIYDQTRSVDHIIMKTAKTGGEVWKIGKLGWRRRTDDEDKDSKGDE